ncbi:hypothetical protein [Ornithinimicrobium murale]|uniref:hypothetical protein n=1 Tax=Ornithinimicrobium murale TaxID=1050153 RepID=UPI0013B36E2B|nr:hypothetical protein [Ornithinimicrobium murale]
MQQTEREIVVDGYTVTDPESSEVGNLRDDAWSLVLDQRAFGPRKLLVFFADADGTMRRMAITDRVEPIDPAFLACLIHLGHGAEAAVAYLDEPVQLGAPSKESTERFARLRQMAASCGITLVDWFSCDDDQFRSARLSHPLRPGEDWWTVGAGDS